MSRKNRNRRGRRAESGELDADPAGFDTTQDRRGRERRSRRERRNLRERETGERGRSPAAKGTPARATATSGPGRRSSGFAFDASGPIPMLAQIVRGCGSCRNWRPDDMPGGRGTCDHPGSGFLNPYADTPACPFYDR